MRVVLCALGWAGFLRGPLTTDLDVHPLLSPRGSKGGNRFDSSSTSLLKRACENCEPTNRSFSQEPTADLIPAAKVPTSSRKFLHHPDTAVSTSYTSWETDANESEANTPWVMDANQSEATTASYGFLHRTSSHSEL